jgi:HAD superfamily phosphoserine phosphatase-like hydrolase
MKTAGSRKVKLAVFDVEGVVIPKNRFLFEVGKSLGLWQLTKILLFGFLYQIGAISLESALRRVFTVMKGMTTGKLLKVFDKVPLMPKAQEVFASLRAQECKTALISSGLPTFIVEKIAEPLGVDYAFGFDVGLNGDTLTGEIWGDVIERDGKARVLQKILKDEGLQLGDCAVVADDRNNMSIFLREVQKIGYNADFVIRTKADEVVTGRLSKVLPAIEGKPEKRELPSVRDFLREAIHASGFFIPLLCILVGTPAIVLMIAIVIALYLTSELYRLSGRNLLFFSTVTRYAASQTEIYDFVAAPLYFAFGILLALLFFKPPVSYAAIACFALGDSTASVFGGLFGKRFLPYSRNKTLEGSLAGFFFAFLAGAVFVSPTLALVGAAVAMTIEYLPLPVNDNVLIPLCTGLALTIIV